MKKKRIGSEKPVFISAEKKGQDDANKWVVERDAHKFISGEV